MCTLHISENCDHSNDQAVARFPTNTAAPAENSKLSAVKPKLKLKCVMSSDWLVVSNELKSMLTVEHNSLLVGCGKGVFYVGRGWLGEALLSGNIYPPHHRLYVCYNGREYDLKHYQVAFDH